jgi:hypothetical protein
MYTSFSTNYWFVVRASVVAAVRRCGEVSAQTAEEEQVSVVTTQPEALMPRLRVTLRQSPSVNC